MVHVLELRASAARLTELGVTGTMLSDVLRTAGFRPLEAAGAVPPSGPGPPSLRLLFSAPPGEVALARLKALPLRAASGRSLLLGECAELELRAVPNRTAESPERRLISMRRLREAVCRDLGWLLNTASLDTSEDLVPYPEVQRSVLNFGMVSLTGRAASSINPQQAARRITEAIRAFEPRLSRVSVTPELAQDRMDQRTLSFRIDAELWGQPAPQRLLLRTRLDVDSGDVSVGELQGG